MKTQKTNTSYLLDRCRGVVAVEMAVILPFLVGILMATFYLGRVYWQYNVVKQVSASAARYVAQGAWTEITDGSRKATAEAMVTKTLLDAGIANSVLVTIMCSPSLSCTGASPSSAVSVEVVINGNDSNYLFSYGSVRATTTVSYPG